MAAKVISSGFKYTSLPESYVRPVTDRPNLSQVLDCDDVPVIDIGCGDRRLISKQIGDACRHYGFFQVINHGVPDEIVEKMQQVGRDFFELPLEEKMKLYSEDPSKTMRLSTSFNVQKEQVHNWRDYLRLHCYPLDKYSPEWPSNPAYFKKKVEKSIGELFFVGTKYQLADLFTKALPEERFKYLVRRLGGIQLQPLITKTKCAQIESRANK
nr:protein downy mildew resistance 6 [Tanacetum cinerariifolium]